MHGHVEICPNMDITNFWSIEAILPLHKYHIALNYSSDVYFFPVIFNQATERDKRLLLEETHADIICDASHEF